MTREDTKTDTIPGWLRGTPDTPVALAPFGPPAHSTATRRMRSIAIALAAALLLGGLAFAVASWLGTARVEKPRVTASEPQWVTETRQHLTGVEQQLALIEQTSRQWHQQAAAAPPSSPPPAELDRLAQRETQLQAERDTLTRRLAAYRRASELRADPPRQQASGQAREAHARALGAAEAELAQARQSPEPDLSWEPTTTAVRDLQRLLTQPPPSSPSPAPATEGQHPDPTPGLAVPKAPQTSPPAAPEAAPVPPTRKTAPLVPTRPSTSPANRVPTTRAPTTPARRSTPVPAPASGRTTPASPPVPFPATTAPQAPQLPEQPPPSSSDSTYSAPEPAPPMERVPTEDEVREATGDDEIARMSQTPEGQALMRQLFGGGGR